MGLETYEPLIKQLKNMLGQKERAAALYAAMKRGRDGRARTMQEFADFNEYRHGIRKIKERSIDNLDKLLERFMEEAQKRGAHVYVARDGPDAISYIMNILKQKQARLIIKSKSLTSEEIEFNEPFEKAGYEVYETDLGEWIMQVAREKPFHLVFPAVHKTTPEVAELFSRAYQKAIEGDISAIMKFVRETLRRIFLSADVGVSGANVAIAENGAIVLETNEGNGRLVTSIPKIHIVLMGMEKIVERVEDAIPLIRGHAVSATGQRTTTYVSIIAGRSPLAGDDGREMHIVILDNGRSRMREDSWFREALYCIRCGACMNICAPYSVSGGHVFGYIYPGPIGIPWTANVHGLDKAKFAHLCISCGLCKEICPAEIDIPMMIARVKELDVEKHGQLKVNRILESYESYAPILSSIAPLWNWLMRRGLVRALMEKLTGIDRNRPLPEFKRNTFMKWYRRNADRLRAGGSGKKVALFVDFFANYIEPQLAITLVEALARAGVEVVVPEQKTSGYPYILYGDLKEAEKVARYNVEKLYPYVKDGYDIISIEPTATYSLRESYPKLLNNSEESLAIASKTYEALEYLWMLVQQGKIAVDKTLSGRAGFHIPCHERGLSYGKYAIALLREAGLDVEIRETGMCCGMAGTFGLKKGTLGIELSLAIGEQLFKQFKDNNLDFIVTESSVCKIQLEQGTGLQVFHPLKLLGDALRVA